VTFKDGYSDTVIFIVEDVPSGGTASYTFTSYAPVNSTAKWYAIADDGDFETRTPGNYTFTTEYPHPNTTFHDPTYVNPTNLTLRWTIDYGYMENVSYRFKNDTGAWTPIADGVREEYLWSGLEPETNYTYYLQLQYEIEGATFYWNTKTDEVRTYYENTFDDIWDTMFQGSGTAKMLLGFVVMLGIIFFGAGAFGRHGVKLGTYGFLILAVIGTALASLMKLFTIGVLLLVIAGAILLVIFKNMFFNGGED